MIYRRHYALLCLAAVLLYLPGLAGPLVFDSKLALSANAAMQFDAAVFDQWRTAVLSSGSGPLGRPVSMFSFALNQAIFGGAAWAIKAFNILIHLAIGAVAYHLLWRLLVASPVIRLRSEQAEKIALASVALWLLHPVQLSSVLYTVQRMEQLSSLFILLGLSIYAHYRVRWLEHLPSARELSQAGMGVLLCALLAVFSKEDGVLLFPLIAWLELMLFQAVVAGERRRSLLVAAAAASSALIIAPLLVAIWQPDYLQAQYELRPWSLAERLFTQLRVLWTYVQWFYLPFVPQYGLHHDDIAVSAGWLEPWTTLASGVAWLLVLALFSQWRRWPLAVFAIGFFLLSHTIESSFVPLEMVYEHRNYMGSLGLALLAVGSLARLGKPNWMLPVLVLAGIWLSAGLLLRSYTWADEERMSSYHLRHHPQSVRAVYHYANTQLRLAELETEDETRQQGITRARRYYEHILELEPAYIPALVSLLYIDGRWFPGLDSADWGARLEKSLNTQVMSAADENSLLLLTGAMANSQAGLSPEQYTVILEGLAARYPSKPDYYRFLATYYGAGLKDYPRAIHYAQLALQREPTMVVARAELIAWLHRSGQTGRSIQQMGESLRHDSDLEHIHLVKGMLAP